MTLIEWRYQIEGEKAGDNSWIENAPLGKWEIQQFKIKTEGDRLNVTSEAFDGPEEAQIELGKILDSWKRESFLAGLRINFAIGAVAQIEMNGNRKTIRESLTINVAINARARVAPLKREFPDSPGVMKDTPDAQRMVLALKKFEDEKDNLCTHAYLIYTIIGETCKYKPHDRYHISNHAFDDLMCARIQAGH